MEFLIKEAKGCHVFMDIINFFPTDLEDAVAFILETMKSAITINSNMKIMGEQMVMLKEPDTEEGFTSCLLLDAEKNNRRSHSPFKNFESIWASLEIFNLIDRPNTISYLLVKDFQNNLFTMPNRLTPRLVNLKIVTTMDESGLIFYRNTK